MHLDTHLLVERNASVIAQTNLSLRVRQCRDYPAEQAGTRL